MRKTVLILIGSIVAGAATIAFAQTTLRPLQPAASANTIAAANGIDPTGLQIQQLQAKVEALSAQLAKANSNIAALQGQTNGLPAFNAKLGKLSSDFYTHRHVTYEGTNTYLTGTASKDCTLLVPGKASCGLMIPQ